MASLFAVINKDKPGGAEIRGAHRPAHLDYLKGLGETLVLAGPFTDDAGASVGSIVVLRAGTVDEARAIAEADPFTKAGLYATTEVWPWKWTLNAPEGV